MCLNFNLKNKKNRYVFKIHNRFQVQNLLTNILNTILCNFVNVFKIYIRIIHKIF